MSTYTRLLYQIVFSTKNRIPCLIKRNQDRLYKYIAGLLKNKECHLYRINGIEDHIHILMDIPPKISVSSLVKDIKLASSQFIKQEQLFPHFAGWQIGFGAFTYSIKEKDRLIEYIKNQEQHHHNYSFREEYISLLKEFDIEFEEKYLF